MERMAKRLTPRERGRSTMHLRLNSATLDYLSSHSIYFTESGEPRLVEGDVIRFESSLQMESYSAFLSGHSLASMGSFSYSFSPLPPGMKIGRYCSISWNMTVMHGNHAMDFVSTSSFSYDQHLVLFRKALDGREINRYPSAPSRPERAELPIIGNDVWIGQDVMLARGIELGDGSVVAAGAVVTKSVPPYAIVGGNPAKLIRMRFHPELIKRLLASQWWRYSFADFGTMRYDKPETFLNEMQLGITQEVIQPFSPPFVSASDLFEIGDEPGG